MNNLIKAIEAEYSNRLSDFVATINAVNNLNELDTWYYNELLPKGKKVKFMEIGDLKTYLIERKRRATNKAIARETTSIRSVFNAGELIDVKITIEWKKSRMWGSNPSAECWYTYTDTMGIEQSGCVSSGSIGGCGYDKQSTAVAKCLNQIDEVLKPLYTLKDKALLNRDITNRELLGYGSGSWLLPTIEGGVGVSCYPVIFEKIGFVFKCVASGKSFDVYTIVKR